jgi:hypothetical protein
MVIPKRPRAAPTMAKQLPITATIPAATTDPDGRGEVMLVRLLFRGAPSVRSDSAKVQKIFWTRDLPVRRAELQLYFPGAEVKQPPDARGQEQHDER